jgi:hypothetical protein
MEDTVPPFVGELPRLLHELGALGKVDMEGRSPLSSNDAYLIADSLAGFGGAHELSLDDCHCEHIVLALAFCRDGGFESNLFDVRDYIRGPSSVWFMDARERMNVYRRFAAAATELGLSELAAAAWAFFITSQTIAFKGQLKADWSELSAQLRNSLHGPGGRILGAAISLSAQHAEEMSEQINALRLRGLLPESPSIPNHRPPISVASLRIPDKREEADMALRELVGEDGWKKLQAKTRDHFVDAWIQLRQLRPGPVNPDIKNWGPIAGQFIQGFEFELTERTEALRNCPGTARFWARSIAHGKSRPGEWTYSHVVRLLKASKSFEPEMGSLLALGGLERLCGPFESLLSELNGLGKKRNSAVHPKPEGFHEHDVQEVLTTVFTTGLLKRFAEALDPFPAEAGAGSDVVL